MKNKITLFLRNTQRLLNHNNAIFDFKTLKFWNSLYTAFFIGTILLAFLAMFSANLLQNIINPIDEASNTSLIIEIHPEGNRERTLNKQLIVSEYLKTQKSIRNIKVIDESQLISYIDNFRGDFKNQFNKIPLPVIIVAELYVYDPQEIQTLRLALSQKVKNVYVDTQQDLIARLSKPISLTKLFISAIPFFALIILMSMLFLIIYSIIFSNKSTIEILLALGLFKSDLRKDFSFWVFYKTLNASLIATLVTICLILLLKYVLFFNINNKLFMNYIVFIVLNITILPILSSIMSSWIVNKIINKNF